MNILILLVNLIISCSRKGSIPGYYVMQENKNYYRFHVDDDLIDEIINVKIELCSDIFQQEEDHFFGKITEENIQDEIFRAILKLFIEDEYYTYLNKNLQKDVKPALLSKKEFDIFKRSYHKNGGILSGEINISSCLLLYERYKEYFEKRYPNDHLKIEEYIDKIKFLFPQYIIDSRDLTCPFSYQFKRVEKQLLLRDVYKDEKILKALYNKYLDRIDNKNKDKRKEELNCAIGEHLNVAKKKLKSYFVDKFDHFEIRIIDGKIINFEDLLNLEGYKLNTRYENNIFYIENIPIKLIKF